MLDILPVTGTTKIVGVFGHPVSHTLSPLMQNRAFAAMQLPYVYVPWHVLPEDLPAAVAAVRALHLAGVNVTLPHKAAVGAFLDEITPEARLFGSVNTIKNDDGRLIGYNTDAPGFLRSLQEQAAFVPAGRRLVFLGAGGSTKPLVMQMLLAGAREISVANRTYAKAAALCRELTALGLPAAIQPLPLDLDSAAFGSAVAKADALINTTSAGMYPQHREPPIVPAAFLHPSLLVCDIVYIPRRTSLLAAAEEAGCHTLAGYGMLAYQGALSIEIWTGQKPPLQLMLDTLEDAIAVV